MKSNNNEISESDQSFQTPFPQCQISLYMNDECYNLYKKLQWQLNKMLLHKPRPKQQNLQPTITFKYRSLILTDVKDSVCKTIVTHPVKLF